MEEVKEMLKAVVNGQHALRSELFREISKFRKEMNALRQEVKEGFEEVNVRLDKQGKQLAYLGEDAPTREEFADLESRVDKLEKN